MISDAPTLVDGYANGWRITPAPGRGALTLTLTWTPQRLVWIAVLITVVATVACLVLVAVDRRRVAAAPEPVVAQGRRQASLAVIAVGAFVGFAIIGGPLAGVTAAIIAVVARRGPHRFRRWLPVVPGAFMALVAAYVVAKTMRYPIPPHPRLALRLRRHRRAGVGRRGRRGDARRGPVGRGAGACEADDGDEDVEPDPRASGVLVNRRGRCRVGRLRPRAGDVGVYQELVRRCAVAAVRLAHAVSGSRPPRPKTPSRRRSWKAFHSLHRFRADAPLRPWLMRIVANEAKQPAPLEWPPRPAGRGRRRPPPRRRRPSRGRRRGQRRVARRAGRRCRPARARPRSDLVPLLRRAVGAGDGRGDRVPAGHRQEPPGPGPRIGFARSAALDALEVADG